MQLRLQFPDKEPAACEQGETPEAGRGVQHEPATSDQTFANTCMETQGEVKQQESLLEQLFADANLNAAYDQVRRNRGAPGIDGVTVADLEEQMHDHWPATREAIRQGKYKPLPVRRVEIPKPGGGKRMLGIPCVMDRLIQQALLQTLTPIFEPMFSESSFGFRPGRSAHDAVQQARKYIRDGRRIVVDIDIEKFFDGVNHDMLMAR